jgi:hypothetical protein
LGIAGLIRKEDVWQTQGQVKKMPAWVFMLFFLVHYGMFVAIQMGLFFAVSGMEKEIGGGLFSFLVNWPSLLTGQAYIMLGAFMISYGFRHITEFLLSGEYRSTPLGYLMFQPYGRIIVQQITVILGSIFLTFGAGAAFIVIFALVKIFFEVFIDYNKLLKRSLESKNVEGL